MAHSELLKRIRLKSEQHYKLLKLIPQKNHNKANSSDLGNKNYVPNIKNALTRIRFKIRQNKQLLKLSDLETWLQKIKKAQHKFESFKVMCCEEDHASHPHLKTIYFRDFCQVSDRPDYLFASYSELSQNDSPQRTLLHLIHAMSIPNKGLILLM